MPARVEAVNGEILEYLKVIAILAGIAVFALVALRLWLPRLAAIRATASGPMQIACRLALEPRKTLYIVRAGSEYVLLAASEAGVQFLGPVDAAPIEAALSDVSTRPSTGFAFASFMKARRRPHEGGRAE